MRTSRPGSRIWPRLRQKHVPTPTRWSARSRMKRANSFSNLWTDELCLDAVRARTRARHGDAAQRGDRHGALFMAKRKFTRSDTPEKALDYHGSCRFGRVRPD